MCLNLLRGFVLGACDNRILAFDLVFDKQILTGSDRLLLCGNVVNTTKMRWDGSPLFGIWSGN